MVREIHLEKPVAYITRDLERALGVPQIPGFVIMTNTNPFGKSQCAVRPDIILCSNKSILDTHELLAEPETLHFLRKKNIRHIMVFKPTTAIERIAKEHGLTILNPKASLASPIEEKITHLSFLEELRDAFLPFTVSLLKEVRFTGAPFVLQFNHSHTGSGTRFIENETQLKALQHQFPERPVRTAPFITGPLFTNNNVVTNNHILVGNINYQITGLSPFTKNRFATIGNDWALPHTLLTATQKTGYETIATRVGEALQKRGWKGLFGIDVIQDEATGQLFLLEINARQSASATFESFLQEKSGEGLTTMEAHLLALLDITINEPLQPITEGAQMTQKMVSQTMSQPMQQHLTETLQKEGYILTPYQNTDPEQDWLRIQTTHGGFMSAHGMLNTEGKTIADILHRAL